MLKNSQDTQELIDLFLKLYSRIWTKIVPILGLISTKTVFKNAIIESSKKFQFLAEINLYDDGLKIPIDLSSKEYRILLEGFFLLTEQTLELMTDLTGDILVEKIKPFLDEIEHLRFGGSYQKSSLKH